MLARMKTLHINETAEIIITIPTEGSLDISRAIGGFLSSFGHEVSWESQEFSDNTEYTIDDLFPDRHPGMLLTGFRLRDALTQTELAERLGIKQNRVSDMERGKRPISRKMAVKLGKIFDIPPIAFMSVSTP